MTDIHTWLQAHALGKYADAFAAQDISVDLLSTLSDADLRELGVASMGDRKRLQRAAAEGAATVPAVASVPAQPAAQPAAVVAAAPAGPEEGERRHATVMFSDLTGYTALNEAFDPEEVEAVMSRIKEQAIAVIERHGGRVNQFVGDEVMAMFGIPVARRDDPRRAVSAALELHHVVDGLAEGLVERLGRRVSMHTGIQSGLVIARRTDSRAGDWLLTGDTVNTAARLRGLAAPGEVVVSQQVWQQVSDWFHGEAGAPVEVKGKERPLVPYRIEAERAVPKAGSSPLVGRGEEMRQFSALLEACLQRQRGRVVIVRGDPGMGKSRLGTEFLHVAREQGLPCHATVVLDFGARTGHDAIRMLVQSLLGLASDADVDSRLEGIAELAARLPSAASDAAFLYELLDVAPPATIRSLLAAMDMDALQKGRLDAVCHLAQPPTMAFPLMLLVEDIHWADAEALQYLAALASLTATKPLLLVMSTRFGGDPSVGDWRGSLHGLPVSGIDLGPLAHDDALRLAAGAATISESLLRSCVERAEGNPLFLEQLLLNAGDEGATSLPGSIQALVQARMDRLAAHDKGALQAAAVWGHRAPMSVVRHLLGDPQYDPRPLVEQFLMRLEDGDYVFCHALIRDGAYGSLLHARRRHLHQLAAEWVEPRDVALAAEHFERAEDVRAAQACRITAQALAADFQYAQALVWVERGLRLVPDGEPTFAWRVARARLLLETGQVAAAIVASDEVLEAAGDGAERAQALLAKASGLRIVDRVEEGLQLLDEAQPLAEAAGMTLELSRLHGLRGNLLFGTGRAAECQQAHERALVLARQAGSVEAEASALGGVGDACYAQGRVATAFAAVEHCLALARTHGLLRVQVAYLPVKGWCLQYLLGAGAALQVCDEALALAERMAQRRSEMMAHMQRALIDGWVRGNWQPALQNLARVLEIARALGSNRFEATAWMMHALLALRAGDMAAAREHVHHCAQIAGPVGMAFVGPQFHAVRARIETDPVRQREILAEGEALLTGSMSHSFYLFCDAAIQVSMDQRDWDEAERYAQMLERYTAAEPFPWSQMVLARARVLCRFGSGERSPALHADLLAVREQVVAAESSLLLTGVEEALRATGA